MNTGIRKCFFNIGDKLTYKHQSVLPDGRYRFGGDEQGGYIGELEGIVEYDDKRGVYQLKVSSDRNFSFSMLESEFLEYDEKLELYNENPLSVFDKYGNLLIAGHWYRNDDWSNPKRDMVKFSCCSNGFAKYNEFIENGEYLSSKGSWNIRSGLIPVTLEDVSKFLPDGHPDKINKLKDCPTPRQLDSNSLIPEDCINGEFYIFKWLWNKASYLSKFKSYDPATGFSGYYGYPLDKLGCSHQSSFSCSRSEIGNIRKATKDEILEWLPMDHEDRKQFEKPPKTKRVEDLAYPDAVHCTTKEQVNAINKILGDKGVDYFNGDKWYLLNRSGENNSPYEGNGSGRKPYVNYEFSDLIFPAEEDDYLNVMDIKVGDTVKCVSSNRSNFSSNETAGAGWEKDLQFVVQSIDVYDGYVVYFGGKNGHGVYSDAVRLIKREEDGSKTEPWSAGSYIVPLQDQLLTRSEPLTKGASYEIVENKSGNPPYIICNNGTRINFVIYGCKTLSDNEAEQGVKWFATKDEADSFGKTIMDEKHDGFTVLYGMVVNLGYVYATHPDAVKLGCTNWKSGDEPNIEAVCKIINEGVVNDNKTVFVIEQNNQHYLIGVEGVELIDESKYLANLGQDVTPLESPKSQYIPYDELEPGQYYFEVYMGKRYIFKADDSDHQEYYINLDNEEFDRNFTTNSDNDKIVLATDEQIKWLDACIEAREYMEMDVALNRECNTKTEHHEFKFNVGDTVIGLRNDWTNGLTGTIITIFDSDENRYLVRFNSDYPCGHDGTSMVLTPIAGTVPPPEPGARDYWFLSGDDIMLKSEAMQKTRDGVDEASPLPTVNFLLNL